MNLNVIRYSSGEESTLGLFLIDGIFAAYTLEDEKRAVKVAGETRIPVGRYRIVLRKEGGQHEKYSGKFSEIHKGMLHITNVPNFRWILIHIGNDDDATAGCLLVGDKANNNNIRDGFIEDSTNAYLRIYPVVADAIERGEEVWIEYFDHIPLPVNKKKIQHTNNGMVNTSQLNLRKSPGGNKQGVLFEGTQTEIIETSEGWHRVKVEGWLSGSYINKI